MLFTGTVSFTKHAGQVPEHVRPNNKQNRRNGNQSGRVGEEYYRPNDTGRCGKWKVMKACVHWNGWINHIDFKVIQREMCLTLSHTFVTCVSNDKNHTALSRGINFINMSVDTWWFLV